MKQQIGKLDWLRFHGFDTSPFESLLAETDFALHPDAVVRSFVEPVGFDRILGSMDSFENSVLFGDSGVGKSTCRLIADYYYRRSGLFRKGKQWALSVPHTHLAQVIALASVPHMCDGGSDADEAEIARNFSSKRPHLKHMADKNAKTEEGTEIPAVYLAHHLFEIFSRMIVAFVDRLRTEPEMISEITRLPRDEKSFIGQLLSPYCIYLDYGQISFLADLGVSLLQAVHSSTGLSTATFRRVVTAEDQLGISQHLEVFTRWLRSLGVSKIYVQVDGVNAIEPAQINCLLSMHILRPLLVNIPMLNQAYGVIFKMFLPTELKGYICRDRGINLEVDVALLDLTWNSDSLRRVLRERLTAYKRDLDRDRTETSFDLFCAPELHSRIEDDLIREADGSPRRLLSICRTMLDIHCSREFSADRLYWLDAEDWKGAIAHYQRMAVAPAIFSEVPRTWEQILLLASRGENSELEFKSSARWDLVQKRTNRALTAVIVKTIAGMLNSNGGVLLIGIQDDGVVLGIEQDLLTITPATTDAYERFLIDSMREYIGLEYLGFTQFEFIERQGKTICVIRILKAEEPVFMLSSFADEFWVRIGNSTRSLTPRATHAYITQHWMLKRP